MNQNFTPDLPKQEYKHGTTTVGITYKGGVVVGADQRASMGYMAASKVRKIISIGINHHNFRCQKKLINSLNVDNFSFISLY